MKVGIIFLETTAVLLKGGRGMSKIIPAILEKSEAEVLKKVKELRKLKLNMAHLDVMDGLAVPNTCWGDIKAASRLDIELEVHLMVKDPIKEALKWMELYNVKSVIVIGEEVFDWYAFSSLSYVCEKLGVAFDPESLIFNDVNKISHLRFFLAMGVKSGFSGQEFNKGILENIALVKHFHPTTSIGVDGGMNENTISIVKSLGIESINTASYFWNNPDKKKVIKLIQG